MGLRTLARKSSYAIAAIAAAMSLGGINAGTAAAVTPPPPAFHGITLQKTCVDPVQVGDPYECAYQITNADDNSESIVVKSVKDQVHSAGGNVDSGELIGSLTWTTSSGASCTPPGPTTTCTLPTKGSAITSNLNSFYTVQPADFNIDPVTHALDDDVKIIWAEPVCVHGGCPVGNKTSSTGASATVVLFTPSVDTLLSPQGPVAIGTPVHDQATINNASPNAGGTVRYAVYSNNTCTTLVQDLGTKPVTNGSVGPSDDFVPSAAGNFWFQATYSGDPSNVGPVSSACLSEPLTVSPNTPTVDTLLSPPGPVAIGTPVTDQAIINNATANAGGTVSYAVFSDNTCATLLQSLGTKPVTNGTVAASDPFTPNSATTVWFQATYSGDPNNTGPVKSACLSEPLTINPNTPSVTTQLTPPGPVTIGTSVSDQATIVGATANAGGTVSYAVYSDNTCATLVQDLGTKPVTNGIVGPSDAIIFNTAGDFWFQATYSGDLNNIGPVSSACLSEPMTVTPNTPTVDTLLSPPGPVAIGTPIHDQATINNKTADAGGTVHYAVYSNNTCTTLVQDLGTFPVTNGTVGPSNAFTPNAAGNFWFQATYSGDPNNAGPVSSACLSEPITVSPNTPSVNTVLTPPGPVAIGTPVQDQATLIGATADAMGTVSYAVYSNNTCTALVQALGTKVVNNGVVGPSDVWTPVSAGNFWFQATYSGDPNNTGPVKSLCTSEPITVSPNTPSVTTLIVPAGPLTIGASAHDTAQISGATATAGGTITYALFANSNCTNLIEDLTPAVNTVTNGIAPDSKSHQFNTAGTFYFQATYSGDINNTGPVSSGCAAEPLVVNAPSVDIVKFTRGADANDPNGADVPNIIPGQPVTWTYQVTNTGTTHPAKADVHVTDNQTGVTPVFDHEQSGNGDQIFDPGEIWIYKATGTALNLSAPPGGVITQPGVCTHNGTETARTAYINLGTATIPGATDNDPSSYCNPPPVVNTPLHFMCYEVRSQGISPGVVTSTDQFGSFSPKLAQMHKLCNPANKNDEDASAVNNENHIDGYEASSATNPAQGRKVKVTDQFGTMIEQLAQVKSVFVPSAKSLVGPVGPLASPGIDHYTCYVVKLSGGFTTIPNVKVQDEFGTLRVNLQAPNEFCAPSNINGNEPGAQTHAQHYNCYNVALAAGQTFKPLANVWVNDEFQARKITLTNHVWELCVPATKSLSGFAPFHAFF